MTENNYASEHNYQKSNKKSNSSNLGNSQKFSQNQSYQTPSNPSNNSISQNPQFLQNQTNNSYPQNANPFFNDRTGGEGLNEPGGFNDQQLKQIHQLLNMNNESIMGKFDQLIDSINDRTGELSERITANELKAEDRDKQVDDRFGILHEKLVAIERRMEEGNFGRRGGSERILWLRGYPLNQNGNPISMSQYRQVLPAQFFEWVQGVTKVGADSFKLRIKEGVECSYYRLGVLMAKHDADFRRAMPNFDTRTKKEHEQGVGWKQNRYYKETRGLDELDEQAVDFSQDEPAGNGENNNVNF